VEVMAVGTLYVGITGWYTSPTEFKGNHPLAGPTAAITTGYP